MLYDDPSFSSLFDKTIGAPPPPDTIPPDPCPDTIEIIDPDAGYPVRFSWKNVGNHNWVSSPRDQGGYGICYAMAASSVAETVYNFHHNLPVDQGVAQSFSPSFIAFFGSFTYEGIPFEWWPIRGTYGVLNGYPSNALDKLCYNGIVAESEFPWNLSIMDTTYSVNFCERYRFTSVEKCGTTKTAIKEALMNNGPVYSTMVYDGSIHYYYHGEVLYDGTDIECGLESPQNHAVVIVGWDWDETHGEYWIVKNSYGTSWGGDLANGYMKLATNNVCGINCETYSLIYNPIQINGGDLAYSQQSITSVPTGHRSVQYKPVPHTLFNGYSSSTQWSTGTTANLSPKNNVSGDAVIKFKVNYGKTSGFFIDADSIEYYEKPIWAGYPVIPTISGASTVECNTSLWYYADAISNSGLVTATSFSWSHSGGIQVLNSYGTEGRIRIQVLSQGTHTLTVTATNSCGSNSKTFYINCPICYALDAVIYPNPASEELTVNIEENSEVTPEFQIELIDSNGLKRKKKETKNLVSQFNIQDLSKGNYVVKIKAKVDNQVIKEKNLQFIIDR